MEGRKDDNGKPRTDLVPPSAIVSMARGFTYGANKYDDRNWEKGINYGRLYGALQRHLNAWWNGENRDPESRLSHLDHAFCCLAMLNDMRIRNNQSEKIYDEDLDTRPYPKAETLDRIGNYYENPFSQKQGQKTPERSKINSINIVPDAEGSGFKISRNGRVGEGYTHVTESDGQYTVRYRVQEPRETEHMEKSGTGGDEHRRGENASGSVQKKSERNVRRS